MTTKASKRQARPAHKSRERELAAGIDTDALRAARARATLETMPMQNMPADAFARAAWGLRGD